jgi:hypothetical protein
VEAGVGADVNLQPRSIELPSRMVSFLLRRHPRSRGLRMTIDHRLGLVVSIPPATRRGWASEAVVAGRVDAFLRERETWIVRHLAAREREQVAQRARGGARDGGTVLYLGVKHRVVERAAMAGVRRSFVERSGGETGDELVVHRAAADRRTTRGILEAWLRARARVAIERAIEGHAPALRVNPTAVTLRDPRSRWGSASKQGRLMFSWRLVLAPPGSLETVVVHELAHLRVFGHGPRFWALVGERRPTHLADRAWLRRHATELHVTLETDHVESRRARLPGPFDVRAGVG